MKSLVHIALIAAFSVPVAGFAADEPQGPLQVAAAANLALVERAPAPLSGAAAGGAGIVATDLEVAAQRGDAQAQVELGVKYAAAEGVPKDHEKANLLFCRAAKYGHAGGLYNLGWAYANGRGVTRDDGVAGELMRRAAERGHEHASKLVALVGAPGEVLLPACMQPNALPVARPLPPPPPEPVAEVVNKAAVNNMPARSIPMAPKEIMQLVERLAPQYEVDANLVLAVIFAESAFNPTAVSSANAQGLMQLIPETAERFGIKQPFKPDENIKGGLAYLRWLLAYFQGDVSLVLAAYNAGEGAVEKHRGIPPYNETRDYVKKITSMYRRTTHPYNSSIARPSPVIEQLKRSM